MAMGYFTQPRGTKLNGPTSVGAVGRPKRHGCTSRCRPTTTETTFARRSSTFWKVIASGGGLGGYSRDLDVKQQLLDLEAGVAAGPSLRLAV